MRHSNIDQYAKDSVFFSFDPRIKIITILFFVVLVALLRDLLTLAIAIIFIFSIIFISHVPFKHLAKRYFLAFPFIFFASITLFFTNNLLSSVSMFLRISTCVLALIFLSSSTPFFDLLKGLQSLKMPNIFIILLMFTYRYFFVFIEEMHRMRLARKARGFAGGSHLFDKQGMKTISYTAGMILVRAYERGLRIYDALLVRGFDGEIKTLKQFQVKPFDIAFFLTIISMSILLFYSDWLVII